MITGFHQGINGYYWPLRWAFRLGELGLIACVVFHAVNGVRIVLFDFWPSAANRQRQIFWWVLIVFLLIMVPVAWIVFRPLTQTPHHWNMPEPENPVIATSARGR